MTKKQQSRMMGTKSLGRPNYSKWEKRGMRVAKRSKRRDAGVWMWQDHVPFDFRLTFQKSRPYQNYSEGTWYPAKMGYWHYPRIMVSWYWKGKLMRVIVQVPNKTVKRHNKERKEIGTEHYVSRKPNGELWGNQVIDEEPVEKVCIWREWKYRTPITRRKV